MSLSAFFCALSNSQYSPNMVTQMELFHGWGHGIPLKELRAQSLVHVVHMHTLYILIRETDAWNSAVLSGRSRERCLTVLLTCNDCDLNCHLCCASSAVLYKGSQDEEEAKLYIMVSKLTISRIFEGPRDGIA